MMLSFFAVDRGYGFTGDGELAEGAVGEDGQRPAHLLQRVVAGDRQR
jgi:hypothetical protein